MAKRSPQLPHGMQSFSCDEFNWITISEPSKETTHVLKQQFPFLLASDLRDLLPPFQRPKLIEREEYFFMVLLFPVYDPEKNAIRPTEVDFLVGQNFLIINHTGELKELNTLANNTSQVCLDVEKNTPELLLYHIIKALHAACFPLLTKISNDIINLEHDAMDRFNEPTLRRMLQLKGIIVDFHNVMEGHKRVIHKLEDHATRMFPVPESNAANYGLLIEQIMDIESFIANDRETINEIYTSAISLMQFKTGEATKTLSAIALIVFPTTLVAAIFSVRAEHIPFIGNPNDFWIILTFVGIMMLATTLYLKSKKWL